MTFIVDAQLPPGLCIWLQSRGFKAQHVFDIGLGCALDVAISEDAFIISKDEDFLILRLPDRFGFIWLRVGNATTKNLVGWLEARWERVDELLAAGERLVELR